MINRTAWIVTGALGVLGVGGGSALAAGPFSTPGANATRVTDTAPVTVGGPATPSTSPSDPLSTPAPAPERALLVDPAQPVQDSAINSVPPGPPTSVLMSVPRTMAAVRPVAVRHAQPVRHTRSAQPVRHTRSAQPVQHTRSAQPVQHAQRAH